MERSYGFPSNFAGEIYYNGLDVPSFSAASKVIETRLVLSGSLAITCRIKLIAKEELYQDF